MRAPLATNADPTRQSLALSVAAAACSGLLLVGLSHAPVAADTVALEGGARLHGAIVADKSLDRRRVAIETPYGRLEVRRSQVERIDPESPAEAEYRRRTPTVADQVEAQFAHAMWCRAQGLADEARRHLRRVVRLDPSHAEARQYLGFQRVNGAWVTREQVLAARGLVRWEGEYRTAEEIALLERSQQIEEARQAWKLQLGRWCTDLADSDPAVSRAAEEQFDSLNDPAAVAPIIERLSREAAPAIRRLLYQTLARLGTPAALGALADAALVDADPEVRALAVERLASDPRPGVAVPFVRALGSPNNVIVNRGAAALGAFGSPSLAEPLINALTTTHVRRIGADSGGQRFDINSASGMFNVGSGPTTEQREMQNPAALASLVEITGVNFLYDKARWRAWLASQQVEAAVDLRRDP